jgi:Right handed beta helix region
MRRLALAAAALAMLCSGCATAFTGSPSRIGHTDAYFQGHVVSNTGGNVESWVEYGLTDEYGSESAHDTISWPANQTLPASVLVEGLQGGTTYHYRYCAQDDHQQNGPGCGEDRVFTTQSVDCGDTVTGPVKLTGPMLCNHQPAFVIGADGVDINLAGHGLSGNWSGNGGPIAIDNSAGFDDLTVHDGSVNGFGFALYAKDASRNRFLNVDAVAESRGIVFSGGASNEISDSDIAGDRLAISGEGSDGLLVAHNRTGGFAAAMKLSGDGLRILDNDVVRSTAADRDRGIELNGSGARIAGNRLKNWALGGIVVSGSDNAVVDNDVRDSIHSFFDPQPPWDGDGIFVTAFSRRTLLQSNFVTGNAGDGVESRDPTSSLGQNTASYNGDYGIDAAAGVTDLGFNDAFLNGNDAQCRNVFCT